MNDFDDLPLRRDLRALRTDIASAVDLWPGIEARIRLAPARRSSRGRPIAWLAGVAAAVLVAFGMVMTLDRHDAMPTVAATTDAGAPAADAADTVLSAYALVLAAEQAQGAQWQQQLSLPGGIDRVAAARELDISLAKMAAALRIDPQSQLLRRLMHQTLQQRAALSLDAFDA